MMHARKHKDHLVILLISNKCNVFMHGLCFFKILNFFILN